jgi:hypothetical protein
VLPLGVLRNPWRGRDSQADSWDDITSTYYYLLVIQPLFFPSVSLFENAYSVHFCWRDGGEDNTSQAKIFILEATYEEQRRAAGAERIGSK